MNLLLSSKTATPARKTRSQLAVRMLAASSFLLTTVAALHADLADDYLAGLRERGWHDTALEYLDQAASDPLATPAFRSKIAYERAATQMELAQRAPNDRQRQTLLSEAASSFQRFANDNPDSPLQLQALAAAGNLLTEQALSTNNKAAKLPEAARAQRNELQQSARQYLDQAKSPLQTLRDQSAAKLDALPKAAAMQNSRGSMASRQQLEAKQAEAKFLLAKLDFEKARTYDAESSARADSLEAAAEGFAKLYEEYEDKLVGFYGRLYQGRSFQESGEFEKALECYWTIVDQPPIANMDFRRLVARAYRRRAECHAETETLDEAIKECREWLEESRGPELTEPEWLAVSFRLATALDAQAESVAGSDANRLRTEARKHYREIAKNPGEFQRDAKARMIASGGGTAKAVVVNTFEEALTAGNDALAQMNSAKVAAKLAEENNPGSYTSLIDQARASQLAAMQYFQQATQLADDETDRGELAQARYFLCYLYWDDERFHDAAVIGEYVARRNPESKYAPLAAKLALAAYERLYNNARQAGEDTDFEASRLATVAELLVTRWPESPEAATAITLQINIALRDDRLSDAEAMLSRLPESSRAGAELRLGRSLWSRYLQASSGQGGPDDAALALKEKAGQLLASGYQALQEKTNPSAADATGVLYYAQYLLANGEAEQAVAALEHPSIGPLTLIDNNSPAAAREQFVSETCKVALRAYVSTEPPQRDKAQEMMASLESAIGDSGNAQQRLINLYVSLGLQLQQQISALTADGQTAKARGVAESFADLLARVTERAGAADDWKVQSWIAQTNLQLGQGLSGQDAARYFQQAEQAYQSLIEKSDQDPQFAPSPIAVLATKKRLADCLQAQQKFEGAFQQYVAILKSKPNMLELQQAAATALQQWGVAKEDASRIEQAIRGAMPQANRKNLVWGWLRLAAIADQAKKKAERAAASDPAQASRAAKYESLFFEARYHAAQARFAAAKLASGAERTEQLQQAKQSVESMVRLYPDLGGPRWKTAYLKLLEQME